MKPVLLVTSHVPPDRIASFAALHEREGIVVARFGGRERHATAGRVTDLPFPVRDVAQRDVFALAREHRAVIGGTVGRVALPAAYAGARAARVPFLLWTALWAHPRTPAHLASWPLLLRIYRDADAVVAYGEHVAGYAAARGARNVHIAPQSVDPAFWAHGARAGGDGFLFVGRPDHEKGLHVLLDAWRSARLDATLTIVGASGADEPGITFAGPRSPEEVRNFLASSAVLVVPSIATRSFREPWGLVVNEAMHQHVPVIASDAVGAAAGGLVRHERNGVIVRQGDPADLAAALRRLAGDARLRAELGANAARDVAAFTPEAWAAGMSQALRSVYAGR
jgi:glycosyltransferase involved in cell wall biosynthesis